MAESKEPKQRSWGKRVKSFCFPSVLEAVPRVSERLPFQRGSRPTTWSLGALPDRPVYRNGFSRANLRCAREGYVPKGATQRTHTRTHQPADASTAPSARKSTTTAETMVSKLCQMVCPNARQ